MGDDASQRSLGDEIRQLRAIVEQWIEQAGPGDRQARIEAILNSQDAPAPPRKPKRDRHGMHIVPGCALLAAGAGWLLRTRARRFALGTAAAAVLTGGTVAPGVLQPAPAAPVPAYDHDAVSHHHRAAVVIPAAVPVRRKRRRLDSDETVRPSATVTPAASPAPTGQPVPVPSPTVTPDPGPTILPTPVPVPTCTNLTGKHCHPGDVAGEVAGWPGALRGLTGQP